MGQGTFESISFYQELQAILHREESLPRTIDALVSELSNAFPDCRFQLWHQAGDFLVAHATQDSDVPGQIALIPASADPVAAAFHEGRSRQCCFTERVLIAPLRWRGVTYGVLRIDVSDDATALACAPHVPIIVTMVSQALAELMIAEDLLASRAINGRRLNELQTILNVSPVGIAIALDPLCERIRVNPAAAAMLGVHQEEYFSKSSHRAHELRFKVLRDGRELSVSELPIQRAARGEFIKELKLDILHHDGRLLHLYEYACPLYDDNGKACGAIGFLVDVTALHVAEEQLAHQIEELADADEHKNRFLALIAHELRNPLSAVASAGQILSRPKFEQHHRWAVELLHRQVQKMSRLVEDLLDASRIARNQLRLQRAPLDMRTVVKEAVEAASAFLEDRHQIVAVSLPEDPILISGDATRLEQVVSNLITNAAKYSDERSRISVALQEENTCAAITVSDQGIGIDPAILPQVFDVFMQIAPESERSRGGLGLGLSLVKSLVELHGGSVTAESKGIGFGSTFTIRIPLLAEQVAAHPTLLRHTKTRATGN